MEIKHAPLFFTGIAMIILGVLVVIFDYPQIQYFESMESESYLMLQGEDKDIHQRLKVEMVIGLVILVAGILLVLVSVFRSKQER